MAESRDKQGPNQVQSEGMTGNNGSIGNKDFTLGQSGAGNYSGAQREAGDEALEGNTGAGGGDTNQAQDSDGNTGVMTNDEFEKDDVANGGSSLRDPQDSGNSASQGGQ